MTRKNFQLYRSVAEAQFLLYKFLRDVLITSFLFAALYPYFLYKMKLMTAAAQFLDEFFWFSPAITVSQKIQLWDTPQQI